MRAGFVRMAKEIFIKLLRERGKGSIGDGSKSSGNSGSLEIRRLRGPDMCLPTRLEGVEIHRAQRA